jgi:hypothetical protein
MGGNEMPEKEIVTFRADKIDLIEIDIQAERLGLSRTEFIRKAIAEKIERPDLGEDENEKGKIEDSDLAKLLACMNSVESTVNEMNTKDYVKESYFYHAMISGFRNICAAIIAANPEDEKALKKLIKDSATWERLND